MMKPTRLALSAIGASALTALSLCVAPAASASPQTSSFACYVSEINDEEASFYCDWAWTGGTGPYTVTARSYDYAAVDWVVVDGQSATIYGWCRIDKYLHVTATVTDSTSATASSGWGGYCRDTSAP